MGGQHARRHEARRFAAPPAEHGGCQALAGQFMGEGQADQAAAQDQHRIGVGIGAGFSAGACRHGQAVSL